MKIDRRVHQAIMLHCPNASAPAFSVYYLGNKLYIPFQDMAANIGFSLLLKAHWAGDPFP